QPALLWNRRDILLLCANYYHRLLHTLEYIAEILCGCCCSSRKQYQNHCRGNCIFMAEYELFHTTILSERDIMINISSVALTSQPGQPSIVKQAPVTKVAPR